MEILMNIEEQTEFLNAHWQKIPKRQRQWHVDNEYYDFVYCLSCGKNKVNWNVKTKSYSRFCSYKCAHAHPDVREKTKQTCLTKYGETTNLKTSEHQQKYKQACLEKYGVDNIFKSQEFKEKNKKKSLEKYGVDNPAKSELVKEKADKTNYERYGRKRYSQVHIPQKIIDQKNDPEFMRHLYQDLKMPVSEIANMLGINHSQLCVHFKQNLGIDISRHSVSWPESQLYKYVKEFCPDAIQSDRSLIKPKEIDILIPEKRLAIEYNGLAWHGELYGNKDKQYHLNKQKLAAEKGYRLIHIFSNEWEFKQSIVKSRLRNILGHSDKIPARKTVLREVKKSEAEQFLNDNHIQGSCFHSVALGLYYQDQLVALMTFGKSRFDKKIQWELLRFVCLQGHTVQGGASKLFSHFCKLWSPSSIVSYCDLRWNTGKLYENLGFRFVKNSSPNYWYISQNRYLESRMKYQKHKLSGILESFDPAKTEWENMAENNYDRIWDCGNSVWHWHSISP